ncbi:tRNA-specific adenosine deaminase 1 [Halyomorpha halys]|uniref:tRNA-specific adenosine deaminase 1 n=1 Tax=Halyomorpha halys TaxID=286706 RepID=UPI0006D4C6EB|nr:tRNA-specific adenosine deaminase 1 [Halyomorpha halys]
MNLADHVAELCLKLYDSFGKNGKPIKGEEWTQLAGVVMEIDNKFTVVSLATGTKCIGVNSMCPKGTILNDSHAEVLARRAFLRFIYEEMKEVKNGGHSEVFKWKSPKFDLRKNLKFHLYTSQVPCGDASIIPMEEVEELLPLSKRQKIDVYRTGAKPLCFGSKQDSKKSGADYHVRGAVRTKPGRGNPTVSLSCSDKIARWIYVGIQGALLSHLIEGDLKLSTVVIGAGGPFNHDIIKHSLIGRSGVERNLPKILQSNLVFCDSPFKIIRGKPAPTSIIWSNVLNKPLDVSSRGRRLGTTTKSVDKGVVMVAKIEFLKQFLSLCSENWGKVTYREIKESAKNYQLWCRDFKKRMGIWSQKPEFENFSV